jgi:hypothetical protein
MPSLSVTPVTAVRVTPVAYLDLDITVSDGGADEALFQESLKKYPGLASQLLTESGPAGRPVHRVQGPLSVLGDWLLREYNGDDPSEALFNLKNAYLASR